MFIDEKVSDYVFLFFPEEMGDVVSEPGPAGSTVQLQPVTWHHSEHRTGSRLPAEEKVGTRGVFTLSGTGTRTMRNNRSLPLCWFKCNVEAFHTVSYNPFVPGSCPVLGSVQCEYAEWVVDPLAPKFNFPISNNISPNFGDWISLRMNAPLVRYVNFCCVCNWQYEHGSVRHREDIDGIPDAVSSTSLHCRYVNLLCLWLTVQLQKRTIQRRWRWNSWCSFLDKPSLSVNNSSSRSRRRKYCPWSSKS